jgi:RHS repeat-associated protein
MLMPERQWSNGSGYRYGFNGKENDNEVKGIEGSQQDYGMRIYDPRIGRFLSVDPLTRSYPWYTPYQFAGNTPIWAVDLDGGEPFYMESRGFSIKWYYQTFNPLTEIKKHSPFGEHILNVFKRDDSKFGDDALDRLRQFANDNYNQYLIHRSSGVENKVYHNSKKLGYYDCVTAQEASLQIILNDYTIKLQKGGNAEGSGKKWEKEGIVGSALTFRVSGIDNKKAGDVVIQSDFKLDLPISMNIQNAAKRTVGTTFFTFEIGKDFHGGIAGVKNHFIGNGIMVSTYFLADQQRGYREFNSAEAFDASFQEFMFINSTVKQAGTDARLYTPGNDGKNISAGNEKIIFRKIDKK